jgi:hypothetical protein
MLNISDMDLTHTSGTFTEGDLEGLSSNYVTNDEFYQKIAQKSMNNLSFQNEQTYFDGQTFSPRKKRSRKIKLVFL